MSKIFDQVVYLDFDGAQTGYFGETVTVNGVEVMDSGISAARIAALLDALNEKYAAAGVYFVAEKPQDGEFSTIYVGRSRAFDDYGTFKGISETIDAGNAVKDDNAFVLLDNSASNDELISTISHETDHLLGTLDHGGSGLDAYGAVVFVGAPDLKITSVAISNTTPTTAQSVKFTVKIKNIGTKPAIATKLYLYEGSKRLGGVVTAAQDAGVTKTYTVTLKAGSLSAGTHKLFFKVDPENVVDELDENNNKSANSVLTVRKATYDLKITSFAVSDLTPTTAESVKFTFKIKNYGNSTSAKNRIYLYDGSKRIASISTQAQAAGATKAYTFTLAAGKLAAGKHSVYAVVDPLNEVKETNEKNNRSASRTLTVSKATRDLRITSFAVSDSTPTTADKVKFTIKVKNYGNSTSAKSRIYIYDGGKRIASISTLAQAAGATKTYAVTLAAGKLAAGGHQVYAMVDPVNEVKETNEQNNRSASRVLMVSRATSDLRITSFAVSDLTPTTAEKVKFTFKVKNYGKAASGKTRIYLYDGGRRIASISTQAQAAGATKAYTFTLAAGKLTAGKHSVFAIVDPLNEVMEGNEQNNRSASRTLTVSKATYDLKITSFAVSDLTPTTAESVKFTFKVKNYGNSTSAKNRIYLYDGSQKIADISTQAQAAGVTKTYTFTLAAGKLAAGTHSLSAMVDPVNEVKEANEKNNRTANCDLVVSAAGGNDDTDLASTWKVLSYGDVDNDGFADMLLGNDTSLSDWQDPTSAQLSELSSLIGEDWKFGGVADWNNDSADELLVKGCATSIKPETDEQGRILNAGKLA